jgi:hypothetical protein
MRPRATFREGGSRGGGGGGAPGPGGGEAQSVDGVTGVEGVEDLALSQVPQVGLAVLAAAGAQGAVGRHGDGVEVLGVLLQAVLALVGLSGELPHLDLGVPASAHDQRVSRGGELDAGNPVGVRVGEGLAGGGGAVGELAVADGVPQLDGLVSGAGNNLAVVGAEGDGQHIGGVACCTAGVRRGARRGGGGVRYRRRCGWSCQW